MGDAAFADGEFGHRAESFIHRQKVARGVIGTQHVVERDGVLYPELARGGPPKLFEMGSGAEFAADIFGERADIGARRAAHLKAKVERALFGLGRNAILREVEFIDRNVGRLALDLLALAGEFVELAAGDLLCRIHRRHLFYLAHKFADRLDKRVGRHREVGTRLGLAPFAGAVAGLGLIAEADESVILFFILIKKLCEPRRPPDQHNEHAGRKGIERAGVADLSGFEYPPEPGNDVVRGHALGFIDDKYAVHFLHSNRKAARQPQEVIRFAAQLFAERSVKSEPVRRRPTEIKDEDRVIRDAERSRERTMNRAVRLLAAKPRSVKELRGRLLEKVWTNEEIVDAVIAKLTEYEYLDDERFARDTAASKLRQKPQGRRLLEQAMSRKQLDRETVAAAVDAAFEKHPESELIDQAIEKRLRLKGRPESREDLKKFYDHLMRQGFGYGLIREKLSQLPDAPPAEAEE